ncbi:Rieske (2Fe-2S) protein [Nocardiopsis sp. MG754419]|uniref:Rieske (2Fe-2S) protein n=1 Tax=Nocardiopsis sp. MG754419 TaxID=2259865 RepID=UPI001BA5611E|nr:Rieske (2Fe-2S) protein [Nocardiopsis sp. MG754419]MBR8740496.1 Rieske (2Fe-2S) protein [Nocardiopsis sp. MG754419]
MRDRSESTPETVRPEVSRRSVFGVAGGGAVVGVVTACGGEEATEDTPAGGGGSEGDGATDTPLTTTGEVPVGEGTILSEHEVVVTQPEEGVFRAFSTTCTHQGCAVDEVVDGQIHCPCHGSLFSIEDGSPTEGPADAPLEEVQVRVDGDDIVLS